MIFLQETYDFRKFPNSHENFRYGNNLNELY